MFNSPKELSVDFDVRDKKGQILFTGGSVIMDYGLCILTRSNCLKLKHLNGGFVSYKYAVLFALKYIKW